MQNQRRHFGHVVNVLIDTEGEGRTQQLRTVCQPILKISQIYFLQHTHLPTHLRFAQILNYVCTYLSANLYPTPTKCNISCLLYGWLSSLTLIGQFQVHLLYFVYSSFVRCLAVFTNEITLFLAKEALGLRLDCFETRKKKKSKTNYTTLNADYEYCQQKNP